MKHQRLQISLLIFIILLLTEGANAQLYNNSVKKKQPNIIVFIVDDMGWQDCSVPFYKQKTKWNTIYHTPNMGKLAAEGMKFTNAYATPVCSPSRVSLMTGMNAARHRVTNWTLEKNQSVDYPDSVLQPPDWNINGMSPVAGIEKTVYATPLPQLLKQADYYTIHCGKAHFGAIETPAADPLNIGFDINIAGHAAGSPGSFLGEENYGNKKNEYTPPRGVPGLTNYHGTDTFLTEALTMEAIKALEVPVKNKQPFFLYMSHYAVHIPFAPDKRFIQKYLAKGLPKNEAEYAALLEGMDKSLGELMEYLDKNKLNDNTVILFVSDNGGFSLAPRVGKTFTHNTPLRAGKGSVYEGGIRVPMLVKYPGMIQPGSVMSHPVIIEDFFPSVLELAGVKNYKKVQQVDGKSFVPILYNPKKINAERNFLWHFPNKWIPEEGNGVSWVSAIRRGAWKLIYFHKTGKMELYNIETDISEERELSEKYPAKLNQMIQYLSESLKKENAQMPLFKITGRKVPYPSALIKK
jgi:arylsulfatase A-like enzyme